MALLPLVLRFVRLLMLLVLVALPVGPALAVAAPEGPGPAQAVQLFENHCAGCHLQGGNIIRRGKTLKLAALERQGVASEQAIAAITASGVGQMSGYRDVLGDEGVAVVARWVWEQAQAGWPRS